MTKKHVMWIIAAIFIIANLMLLRVGYTTWGPIKRVESLASVVAPQTLQILRDKEISPAYELLTPKPLLVVWADDGRLYRDVQQLFPTTLWPKNKDDIAYLVAVTRTDRQDGTYMDGQPGYRIDYVVELVSYSDAQELAQAELPGSSSPFSKQGSGPAYGTPPTDDDIAFWIKSEIGVQR